MLQSHTLLVSEFSWKILSNTRQAYNANINVMVPSESLEMFLISVEKLGHEVTDKR